MGKTIVTEEMFPEIVEQYNCGGKTAAYDFLRSRYKIKHPYFVINRIRESGNYSYNSETDRFSETAKTEEESVFMGLEELCGTVSNIQKPLEEVKDTRPEAMEKLVRELISDRLLMLSRYITLDTAARRVLIDQTSLMADGYQIVTH